MVESANQPQAAGADQPSSRTSIQGDVTFDEECDVLKPEKITVANGVVYPLAIRFLPPTQPYQFETKSFAGALVIQPTSAFDRVAQSSSDTVGRDVGPPPKAAGPIAVVTDGKEEVKSRKSKKRVQRPFPFILRRMVNGSDPSLISWTPCGTGFMIEGKDPRISSAISPYFAHGRYQSLRRSLSMHGFRWQKGVWHHPNFQRDSNCSDTKPLRRSPRFRGTIAPTNNSTKEECDQLTTPIGATKPSHQQVPAKPTKGEALGIPVESNLGSILQNKQNVPFLPSTPSRNVDSVFLATTTPIIFNKAKAATDRHMKSDFHTAKTPVMSNKSAVASYDGICSLPHEAIAPLRRDEEGLKASPAMKFAVERMCLASKFETPEALRSPVLKSLSANGNPVLATATPIVSDKAKTATDRQLKSDFHSAKTPVMSNKSAVASYDDICSLPHGAIAPLRLDEEGLKASPGMKFAVECMRVGSKFETPEALRSPIPKSLSASVNPETPDLDAASVWTAECSTDDLCLFSPFDVHANKPTPTRLNFSPNTDFLSMILEDDYIGADEDILDGFDFLDSDLCLLSDSNTISPDSVLQVHSSMFDEDKLEEEAFLGDLFSS